MVIHLKNIFGGFVGLLNPKIKKIIFEDMIFTIIILYKKYHIKVCFLYLLYVNKNNYK